MGLVLHILSLTAYSALVMWITQDDLPLDRGDRVVAVLCGLVWQTISALIIHLNEGPAALAKIFEGIEE